MYNAVCVLKIETKVYKTKAKGYLKFVCILFCCIAITEAGKVGDPLTVGFFKEEYTLNFTIGEDVINNNYLILM